MNNQPHTPMEDVIDEIMLEENTPSHAALMRWAARYPEHRDALTRFFATWAMQETSKEKVTVDETLAGERMVSKALNILYQQTAPSPSPAELVKPLRLCRAIKAHGLTEKEFAARCDLDDSLVDKLDLRRIPNIPRRLYQLVSVALGLAIDVIRDMCVGEPVAAAANMAKGKPVIRTEEFLDAVRASDLPEELKAKWIETVAAEKCSGEKR